MNIRNLILIFILILACVSCKGLSNEEIVSEASTDAMISLTVYPGTVSTFMVDNTEYTLGRRMEFYSSSRVYDTGSRKADVELFVRDEEGTRMQKRETLAINESLITDAGDELFLYNFTDNQYSEVVTIIGDCQENETCDTSTRNMYGPSQPSVNLRVITREGQELWYSTNIYEDYDGAQGISWTKIGTLEVGFRVYDFEGEVVEYNSEVNFSVDGKSTEWLGLGDETEIWDFKIKVVSIDFSDKKGFLSISLEINSNINQEEVWKLRQKNLTR
ncbi:MAG: hypothetical protein OQK82_03985 [Candidatus Pacearchaeota archaeon]|nr:hypothetical protein [Candidatus Pacearchaeota archaeon]